MAGITERVAGAEGHADDGSDLSGGEGLHLVVAIREHVEEPAHTERATRPRVEDDLPPAKGAAVDPHHRDPTEGRLFELAA